MAFAAAVGCLVLAAGFAAAPDSSNAESADRTPAETTAALTSASPNQVIEFTYEEAKALGYDVDPDADLARCTASAKPAGFDSEEAAVSAAEKAMGAPECAGNPADLAYWIGGFPPTSGHQQNGYHHNGQQTSSYNSKGGKGTFKVKDITDLAHPGPGQQFVVDRILIKKLTDPTACQKQSDTARWAEVGWTEASFYGSSRYIYSWGVDDCMWRQYTPSLDDDQFYSFRARRHDGALRTGFLLSDGTWQQLAAYDHPNCINPQGGAECAIEDYVEVFTSVDNNHPDWSGTIGNKALELWKANDNWISWDNSVGTSIGDVTPYVRCGVSAYDYFTVQKGGTC